MEIAERSIILIVDDIKDNIDLLTEVLKGEYDIKAAVNGAVALKIAEKFKPDMILLDVLMPEMSGYEVLTKLKENPVTRGIPVIFVTGMSDEVDEEKGLLMGAVDYVTKPVNPVIVKARVKTHLNLANQRRALYEQVQEKTMALRQNQMEIINVLGRASDYRDTDTGLHIHRISEYCSAIARALDFDDEAVQLIRDASPMHDVGKIGIADAILQKPGKLTVEEFDEIKKHPSIGEGIIGNQNSEVLTVAKIIAMQHHERVDGRGYPNGLTGAQINLNAKITAVADVFDALTSARPYKEPWPIEKAIALINEESGKQFDAQVVAAFNRVSDEIQRICILNRG